MKTSTNDMRRSVAPSHLLTWIAIAACLQVNACGPAAGSPTPEAGAFFGSWSCTGTQIENCPNGSHADDLVFTLEISGGPTSASITTSVPSSVQDVTTGTALLSGTGGGFVWTTSGDEASLDAPASGDTVPGSLGGLWTPTYTTGSATRTGNTLNYTDSGTAIFADGFTETCGFTQTITCTAL